MGKTDGQITPEPTAAAAELVQLTNGIDKLSLVYSKYGGRVPGEQMRKYSKVAAAQELLQSRNALDKMWLVDYVKTIAAIENDKAKTREGTGIEEIGRELITLPKLTADTIKLSELVLKPEVFDGVKPKPRKWIQSYNEAIVANGWSDRIAVKYLPTFLALSAKDWYFTEVKPYLTVNTEWYQVYGLFVDNYLSQSDHEQLTEAVENARQRAGESVSNFIPRIRRLLLLLTPNLPEGDQLRQLKNKLRPEYKQLLAFCDPKTIQEFRISCMKIEAGLPKSKTSSDSERATRKAYSKPEIRNNTRRMYRKPYSKDTRVAETSSTNSVGTSSSNIVCYNCGKKGHISRNCSVKKTSKPFNRRQVNMVNEEDESTEEESEQESETSETEKEPCERSLNVVTVKQGLNQQTKPRYVVTEEPLNLVVGGGKLLKQDLICNGVKISAVVDTGAYVTVIDSALVSHFKWNTTSPFKPLVGADGAPLATKGMVELKIEMCVGSIVKSKVHQIAVVENLTAPMLLGLELMREFKVVIDVTKQELSFTNEDVGSGIRTVRDELIPARCQMILEGRANVIGSILTKPFNLDNGLIVANSVGIVANNLTKIAILNPLNRSVSITKGTQLASLEELEEANCSTKLAINQVIEVNKMKEKIRVGDGLADQQIKQLTVLLNDNVEAFSINGEIGETNVHKHCIEIIPEAEPFAEPLRRRAQIQIEETRRQVKELLKEGIIEESSSPWASAYVLAKKKNGEFRLCIDFRKLNLVTKKVVYPLPNIEECLETLSGKKYFTQLDFKSGFWQIAMDEESKKMTAFRTEDGLFHFNRMPFGLTNAPASFQKMINTVLAGLKGMNLQVFIDDVCIATKTWSEHLIMLEKTLKAVINARLKIKADKCVFGSSCIKFLGHEVSQEGIRQDPEKLKALTKMPLPTDAKGVKRALGMFSYYRKFVSNFAMIVEPLTKLTRKGVDFEWREEQQKAYDKVINELKNNATLSHYNHEDPLLVKTDASRKGVAGMLFQKQGGEWRLITCCSRRLSTSEVNYGITDLEGLAVIYTVNKLRPYLLGKKFQILVDHCALCVLNKRTPASARLRRWAIVLSEYDFEIVYTKGNLHCDIDCLSRAPVDDPIDPYLERQVYMITPYDKAVWRDSYKDKESKDLFQKAYDKEDGFILIDDIIYKGELLFVPDSRRAEIIHTVHSSPMNGHPGITATISKLRETYWWPSMRDDVTKLVNICTTCLTQKPVRAKPAGQMHSFQIFQPGEQVAIDLIEKITESHSGNQYIIVAIDMFTRFVEAKAVPDKGAPTFTQFLLEYCGRFGVPRTILSDQSTTFCNEFTNQVIKVFGASHVKSTPYHSQGNAVVERVNQTLEEKIRLVLDDPLQEKNWDAVLPIAVLAINTTYHSSLGCTPYEMTFGVRPPLQDRNVVLKATPYDLHAKLIKEYLRSCYSNAVAIQTTSQEKSKKYFENRRRNAFFELNELVVIKTPTRSSKLSPKYQGPYKIVGVKEDIYTLENIETGRTTTRHVADIRSMNQRTSSSNATNVVALVLPLILAVSFAGAAELLFDRVRPIIWTKVKSQVNLGVVEYDVHFAYTSPCPLFEQNIIRSFNSTETLSEDDRSNLDAFTKNCKALWIMEWQAEINQLLDVKLPKYSRDHVARQEKPYQENSILNTRRKREVNLDLLLRNDTYKTLPGGSGKRMLAALALGPFSHVLFETPENEAAAMERLIKVLTLRNQLRQAGNVEIYVAKLVREDNEKSNKTLAKRETGEYPLLKKLQSPDPKERAAAEAEAILSTDYTFWEITGMMLCPICIPSIRNNAIMRTYSNKIEEVTKEIEHILDRINIETFVERVVNEGQLTRRKRGIFDTIVSEVLTQTVGVFTGNVVSNLISFAIERINPESNTNRLNRLQSAYEDMKKNFEVSRQIDRGILDNIDKLSNVVQDVFKRVNNHVKRFPQYTWLASLIVNKITQSGMDLQRISDEAAKGRIAIEPFVRLTGITGLKQFAADDTNLISVVQVNNYTLNFKFTAMLESPDTKVYKVHAFDHWDNLDETPKYLHYSGANYLIYNETSNCIKSLSGTPDDYVGEQCVELDGEDPELNGWKVEMTTDAIENYANVSQAKKTLMYNYIYCFPGTIDIDGKKYKCPMDVFRLKVHHEYRTARQRHVPSMLAVNATMKEVAVDAVHAGHFDSDSDVVQHLAMFEQLRKERRRLHNITTEYENSFVVNKNSSWFWAGATIWLSSVGGTLVYWIVVFCLKRRLGGTRGSAPPTAPPTQEARALINSIIESSKEFSPFTTN